MNISQASGRQVIDVAEATEIARMARGSDPNTISTDDMQSLLGFSALVLDGQRSRPRYFDGRFLTGADLTGDQDYIRQRQDDLASAVGTGVVAGLQVSLGGSVGGQTLVIEAGHGVTPTGELVMVTSRRAVPILDLAAGARLDATLGLSVQPRAQLGKRTGLFLLVLRPVQFTANPIAAYPTAINGPRTVEDGDIIEATAIDLIPYPNTGGAGSLDEARRAVARDLFLGQPRGLPQDALPLAMVALAKGVPTWIDVAMVRRETGADTPLQVSMGGRPRALAEAFVVQHRAHLADVLASRAQAGLTAAFAAAQYFAALPAAGQMPAAAILPDDLGFRQMYFPDAVDVDLSFVPSDEVAALVEESLALSADRPARRPRRSRRHRRDRARPGDPPAAAGVRGIADATGHHCPPRPQPRGAAGACQFARPVGGTARGRHCPAGRQPDRHRQGAERHRGLAIGLGGGRAGDPAGCHRRAVGVVRPPPGGRL